MNPNVEMKDSGVEWIGEIPSHWEIKKIHVSKLIRNLLEESKFLSNGIKIVKGLFLKIIKTDILLILRQLIF